MKYPKPITIHSFVAFYGEAEITAVTRPLGRHTVTTETHITKENKTMTTISDPFKSATLFLFVFQDHGHFCLYKIDTFVDSMGQSQSHGGELKSAQSMNECQTST